MGECRPFRPSESRFVPFTDGMQRGNHWFKPQEALKRSAPSVSSRITVQPPGC